MSHTLLQECRLLQYLVFPCIHFQTYNNFYTEFLMGILIVLGILLRITLNSIDSQNAKMQHQLVMLTRYSYSFCIFKILFLLLFVCLHKKKMFFFFNMQKHHIPILKTASIQIYKLRYGHHDFTRQSCFTITYIPSLHYKSVA